MNKKKRLKIIIKKEYKEKMNTEEEKANQSTPSNDPKSEDFSWTEEKNYELIHQYLQFPFEEWHKIIDDFNLKNIIFDQTKMYQEVSCLILEKNVFNKVKFYSENNKKMQDIFPTCLKELGIPNNRYLFEKIKPDFMVINISKEDFIKIINFRNYMFKYDANYNKIDNIERINIIGEIKLNPDNIKIEQKNRYLTFCEYFNLINSLYNKKEYFMILYISDSSFKKFNQKFLHINKPIILGYIPRLYNEDYFKKYIELKVKVDTLNIIKTVDNKEDKNPTKLENKNDDKERNNGLFQNIIKNNNNNNDNELMEKENSNKDWNNMSLKELLFEKRNKEDIIRNKKRKLKDDKHQFKEEKNNQIKLFVETQKKEKTKFKENMKLLKRNKKDLFLQKKREIENEEIELERISDLYNRKTK